MLNVELLKKVKTHILEEPRRLHMSRWLIRGEPGEVKMSPGAEDWHEPPAFELPACGTVACIAGWTATLGSTGRVFSHEAQKIATDLLDICDEQADELFMISNWPTEYREAYFAAGTPENRAKVAAQMIDYFISENS